MGQSEKYEGFGVPQWLVDIPLKKNKEKRDRSGRAKAGVAAGRTRRDASINQLTRHGMDRSRSRLPGE